MKMIEKHPSLLKEDFSACKQVFQFCFDRLDAELLETRVRMYYAIAKIYPCEKTSSRLMRLAAGLAATASHRGQEVEWPPSLPSAVTEIHRFCLARLDAEPLETRVRMYYAMSQTEQCETMENCLAYLADDLNFAASLRTQDTKADPEPVEPEKRTAETVNKIRFSKRRPDNAHFFESRLLHAAKTLTDAIFADNGTLICALNVLAETDTLPECLSKLAYSLACRLEDLDCYNYSRAETFAEEARRPGADRGTLEAMREIRVGVACLIRLIDGLSTENQPNPILEVPALDALMKGEVA